MSQRLYAWRCEACLRLHISDHRAAPKHCLIRLLDGNVCPGRVFAPVTITR